MIDNGRRPARGRHSPPAERRRPGAALAAAAFLWLLLPVPGPAGAAEPPPAAAPAEAGFFWKLRLEGRPGAGAGAGAGQVELLPGGAAGGLIVRIGPDRAALLAAGAHGGEKELAAAKLSALPATVVLAGRAGLCRLILDGRPVLAVRGAGALAAVPAWRSPDGSVKVSEGRRVRPEPLLFLDGFSRAAGEAGPWSRRRGNWESAAHFFAGHSANAGALCARFAREAPADPLTAGRTEPGRTGLGAMLMRCGPVHLVERIAGGSPAERAGLAAGDIVVEINGERPGGKDSALAILGLGAMTHLDKPTEFSVLRPGDRQLRQIRVVPGEFVWGRSRQAVALPGAAAAGTALALVGEDFWRPGRVEVAARTHGGAAFGLAFAGEDGGGAWVFRLRPSGRAWRAELLRVGADGAEAGEPLAGADLGAPWSDSWYRLAVELVDDERSGAAAVRCLLGEREVLRAVLPAGGYGPAGLWAGGPDGWAEFDDFGAADDPAELARRAARPAAFPPLQAAEPDMLHWAAPGCDFLPPEEPGGAAVWRFPCLSGAEVWVEALPKDRAIELTWSAPPGAGGPAACSVRLDPAGRAELAEAGRVLAAGTLAPGAPCVARLAAGQLSLSAGGRELLRAKVGALGRERLAVRPASAALSGAAAARPAAGLDLGFERAPAELVAPAGAWGLTNKWVCDPRWSWYGARAAPMAAAWTARSAGGDMQLDAFAALMMQRMMPPFERAHDFGLSLCGDGRSVWSGYALVFGAEGNRATRLYRRGALVAETDRAGARFPPDFFGQGDLHLLHQRWFRLTLSRRGARVSFLSDGREELAWTDPEPLADGRAAVWTFDNGMMLARLRLDAARLGPAEPDLGAPPPPAPGPGWEPAEGLGPPPRISPAAGGMTRVEAVAGGGPLALRAAGLTVNPNATGSLALRLRAPEGTAADLYLDGPEGRYRIGLVGPAPSPEAPEREVRWLGQAPVAATRGEEREFAIPLGALWRDYWGRRSPGQGVPTDGCRVLVGCFAAAGPAAAGLGANRPGAWYEVSELKIAEVREDREPPKLGELRHEPGTEQSRARLVLPLADPGGSGVNRAGLALALNDQALKLGAPGVTYSEAAGELVVDLAAVGALPGPDGEYRLKLSGLADFAGNRCEPRELAVRAAAAGRRPPERVRVRAALGAGDSRQELALDLGPECFRQPDGSGRCLASPLLPAAPGGPEGWELTALHDGGPFSLSAAAPGGNLDLGRCPEIEFAYRVESGTPFLLGCPGKGREVVVPLNDRFTPANAFLLLSAPAAEVKPVALAFRADGQWHNLTVPLAEIWRQQAAGAGAEPPLAAALRFGDVRHRGSRAGMHFAVAGLRLVPAARPAELSFSWSAWDEGGVADCRSAFDQSPDTVPRERLVESGQPLAEKLVAGLADGPAWLHLAFRDRAGNWSAPQHYRVLLDSRPPAAAVRSTGGGLEFTLTDASGVDPASLRLEAGGRELVPGRDAALAFEPASGRLRWNARAALGRALADGETVEYQLTAADYAGNRTAPPLKGACKADFQSDRQPPAAPRVRCWSAGPMVSFFDRGPGEAGALSPSARVEVVGSSAAWGRGGLKLVKTAAEPLFRAGLHPRAWPVENLPIVALDCRAAPGARLELCAEVSGHPVTAALAGPGGLVPADGRWHHLAVDLAASTRAQVGELPALVGRNLEVREPPGAAAAAGALLEVDNLEFCRAGAGTDRSAFLLESSDAGSGLAGFAVALDREEGTVPEKKIGVEAVWGAAAATFRPDRKLEPGDWWLHAAAVDFAGNWSPVTHYRVAVR